MTTTTLSKTPTLSASPEAAPRRRPRRRGDLRDRVALVTGAGSGIGAATALALAEAGARLVLCDVDAQGLLAVERQVNERSTCVLARVVDVSDREDMRAFADEVHELVPALDVLVNNAGVAAWGTILDTPLEEWDRILSINVLGVANGCALFLPRMVERGEGGHVVNVSSVSGFLGNPGMTTYTASKFAVTGLSESLRNELHPHGIGVSTICPGMIDTGMIQKTPFVGRANRERAEDVMTKRAYGPEGVARAVLSSIRRNRALVPVTPEAWVLYYLKRLSPALVNWVSRFLSKQIVC